MESKWKVLLADASVEFRGLLRSALEETEEFEVVASVGDGLEAARLVKEKLPDLVLMDIDMPEMDGIETAKRIMEMTDRTVPILFVTALCDRQTVTLCRNLDAAGYIVRPYKPVFVKTEIKRILMGRSEIE